MTQVSSVQHPAGVGWSHVHEESGLFSACSPFPLHPSPLCVALLLGLPSTWAAGGTACVLSPDALTASCSTQYELPSLCGVGAPFCLAACSRARFLDGVWSPTM